MSSMCSMSWDTLASIATAIGVAIAAWQIWESRKLAQSQFEDTLDQQYRALLKEIPVDALIGDKISEEDFPRVRELIFNYLDLSNEQTYLRRKKRVTESRWIEWCAGIENNISKPVFKRVWIEVKENAPNEFSELMLLESNEFKYDPANRT